MTYNFQDLTDVIRSLHAAKADCDQVDCKWRALCLEEQGSRGWEPDS